MPQVFQASRWMLELPDGWTAEAHEGHAEIRLPLPGARLRLTPYTDEAGHLSAADWLRAAAHFDRSRGRPILAGRWGDFAGHETRFEAGGEWIRGWALTAGEEGLDVNYRCAAADAGRDDVQVDAVLSTLRLRRPAT